MLCVIRLFAYAAFSCVLMARKPQYFPPSIVAQSVVEFANDFQGMKEPSLLEQARHPALFRFRVANSFLFDRVLAIRIEVEPDGSGTVYYKEAEQSVMYINRQIPVTAEEGRWFIKLFEVCQFMDIPFEEGSVVLDSDQMVVVADGDTVICEGVLDGCYHVIARERYDTTPIGDDRFQEMIHYQYYLCEPIL